MFIVVTTAFQNSTVYLRKFENTEQMFTVTTIRRFAHKFKTKNEAMETWAKWQKEFYWRCKFYVEPTFRRVK